MPEAKNDVGVRETDQEIIQQPSRRACESYMETPPKDGQEKLEIHVTLLTSSSGLPESSRVGSHRSHQNE